jgi:UDP-sulfoquinovose synthase
MHLSAHGHTVTVVDNYLRRRLARDEDVEPLFPVPNLAERVALWQANSGHDIRLHVGDLQDWSFVEKVVRDVQPDAIVHYAEQPSAPYSMLRREAATLTLQNNLNVTANLIFAVRELCPGAHIVKLGTMGEYGTPNIDIEEGWIEIAHNGRKDTFLYPRAAGSLYHTTKVLDTDLLWFYVRLYNVTVTDLMQGPVYGLVTPESQLDDRLLPNFHYDDIFGTVVNRFLVQAVAGVPLTVYGAGGQTRGYLNLNDTLQCIELAVTHPPARGELRILNQFTETFTVNELAERVAEAGRSIGLGVEIKAIANPRKEREQHYYHPAHTGLIELGLEPHLMSEEVLVAMLEKVQRYADHIDRSRILPRVRWNPDAPAACAAG